MLGTIALILVQSLVPPVDGAQPDSGAVATPTERTAVAVRAPAPPVIDGRDDDPVWRLTAPITDFKQWEPTEGKDPTFGTEARIAYDAANLYVFVRAFDPHPDSIIRLLDRRDTWTPADKIGLLIDAYHDRRTGFEFWVTPAGVRLDVAIFDDNEDQAWDAVWDVATRVDSLGWTAEFRIPLSQLRYAPTREHTFGFLIGRDIYRLSERTSWPQLSQSVAGLTRQFGDVSGFDDLEAPRRLEAAPYVVARNEAGGSRAGLERVSHGTVGADFKYRVASNLTLDATVNPDFGQVEADPSVLNLTAYETFYQERRPFFVAGRGVFRFNVGCDAWSCGGEGLYYSRRIGRAPQLSGLYGPGGPEQPTTILGAGKLTGRLPGGFAVGLLEAYTERATRRLDTALATSEPATNFAALRVKHDWRDGGSSVGGMVTAVNRALDAWSAPYLARNAYAGAVDFRHRFLHQTYEVTGSLDASRVAGSRQAVLALQRNSVHNYQRPDAGLPLDSTRTALSGDAEELTFGKVAGTHLNFQTAYHRRSPGFDVNDLGYLQRAGNQQWNTWVGVFDRKERRYWRSVQWNWNWFQWWTSEGLAMERGFNTNFHLTLRNSWNVHVGNTWGQIGETYDDRLTRGGPAVRQDPYISPWFNVGGDDRRRIVPYFNLWGFRGGAGHKTQLGVSPSLDVKVSSRLTASASFEWSTNDNGYQWYGNFADSAGGMHYTVARLKQTTAILTARVNFTVSPTMTLQVYGQPFISKGTYSDVRELSATPRAARYDDRYQPYGDSAVAANPGGFNFKQFRSNVVFRWEYRPGSTLFVVWTQGREGFVGAEGASGYADDLRDLFRQWPDNTFLVKVSYWLNR